MSFGFYLVDAFTTTPLMGNPCAVVLDADRLSAEQMLQIAREMNQSETAFLMNSDVADLKARYFTPAGEIPLAGHPTIASIHTAIQVGIISVQEGQNVFSLELNDGPIRIEVQKSQERTHIKMFQRKPQFGYIHDPGTVLPLFGLTGDDIMPGSVIQTVSTGTPQMMILLTGQKVLKKIQLKVDSYNAYKEEKKFFSTHLFCLKGISDDAQTFARHFVAPPDLIEDAFTGSATGNMGAYLWKYELIVKPTFIAEQGHWMGRPGRALVEVIGPAAAMESVAIAGAAVTTVKGELFL